MFCDHCGDQILECERKTAFVNEGQIVCTICLNQINYLKWRKRQITAIYLSPAN